MILGVPTEVKADEYRVGIRPVGVEVLAREGHTVLVQSGAGLGSGFEDDAYRAAGADVVGAAADVWSRADLIVKVKEPQASELALMREGQFVFTYFHLAADKALTVACLEKKCIAIAYETLTDDRGGLPLLTPMSEVAGKLSVQQGAKYLERPWGGRGVLLGGVPGVAPGHVLVLGGGVVGTCAAQVASGMGADVVILDISIDRLRRLGEIMPKNVRCVYSDPQAIRERLHWADLIIGAVLVPGAKAPWLIRRDDLRHIQPGSVIVDVAIDQGGCVETSRVTTHRNPVYDVDGIVHYGVGNMPAAVARTSTLALTNVTLPWVSKLARYGPERLARMDHHFASAINVNRGRLTNQAVAHAHELEFEPLAI
ncbi:MAG: alanine dehydrogenase [Phycisphaerae bacterium]|nr:alanine dehydrogenase [Phycisphaerae bacterium]